MNNNMVGCYKCWCTHESDIHIRQTKPSWLESCDGVGGGGVMAHGIGLLIGWNLGEQ